jgi:hypothetical protein
MKKSKLILIASLSALLVLGCVWSFLDFWGLHLDDSFRTMEIKVATNTLTKTNAQDRAENALGRQILEPLPFHQRLKAIHAIDGSLTSEDCGHLVRFVTAPTPPVELDQIAALKNDLLLVLRHQTHLPVPFNEFLSGLYQDKAQHTVIRDYALQHLFMYYEETDGNNAGLHSLNERDTDIFWHALNETTNSIAGTAVIGLNNLAKVGYSRAGVDLPRIRASALELASDPFAHELSRISALQICAELDVNESLQVARHLLQESTCLPLRLSAVAAIGKLGQSADIHLLESEAHDANFLLQAASERAVKALASRKIRP